MTENRKLDMSLDDIIRMDGIKGPRRGGGGGGGRSGPRSGDTQRRNFSRGGNDRYQPKRLNAGGSRAYSYNGDRNYGSGGGQNRYSNGGGYRGRSMNGFEGSRGAGGGGGGRRQTCTLHISNLAQTVNAEDVEELFASFGDLVRSTVHYDQHGNSLGTADVIFEQRESANEARHKLNNVTLDGRPMRITMLNESDDDPFQSFLRMSNNRSRNGGDHQQQNRSNFQSNRSSNRMSNQGGGGSRMGGGGGGSGGRRDNNGRSGPAPSAEDLDKEMDDWRMQVDADNA